jgi:hypothetical protein
MDDGSGHFVRTLPGMASAAILAKISVLSKPGHAGVGVNLQQHHDIHFAGAAAVRATSMRGPGCGAPPGHAHTVLGVEN